MKFIHAFVCYFVDNFHFVHIVRTVDKSTFPLSIKFNQQKKEDDVTEICFCETFFSYSSKYVSAQT